MSEYIIDILKEEYKNFPISLDGEVLLEITRDDKDNISGYLTIKVDKIKELKTYTEAKLEHIGMLKYKNVLDSFTF